MPHSVPMHRFSKRSFSAGGLWRAGIGMLRYLHWAAWAYLLRGLQRSLAEKILLMVSGINDCRYCRWLHSHLALRGGVAQDEIDGLLNQWVPGDLDAGERAALRFAMHYAESGGFPPASELEHLGDFFTPGQVKAIRGLCAAIYFGNLCGNTHDAFLHRLRGRPVEGGSVVVETLVFLLCFPLLAPLLRKFPGR